MRNSFLGGNLRCCGMNIDAPLTAACAAILAIAALFYGPFTNNFFSFDDFKYLENVVTGPGATALGYNAQLRVVSNFAWLPLFWISGFDPTGYAVFSLLLAVCNSLLLYVCLVRLPARKDVAFLASVIFMAAPAGADAVFWKMSTSGLLSLFFMLSSCNLYLSYRDNGKTRFYAMAIALFALAMFSKEDAIALVPLILCIELLFRKGGDFPWRRILPFVLVIAGYLSVTTLVYRLLNMKSETWKFFQLKPLYSLLGGFTSFFIGPDGSLSMSDPRIYLAAVLIAASFFIVRDKRMLIFSYAWILFTFLPSSLSSIATFSSPQLPNSISRFLYTPSAGAALAAALVLAEIRTRWKSLTADILCGILLALFLFSSYKTVHTRGEQWEYAAEPTRVFLREIRKVFVFPRDSHVFVEDAPTGRAFVQQALRAFYRNPTITWIADPRAFRPADSANAIFIRNSWQSETEMQLAVFDMKNGRILAASSNR